MPRVLFLTHPEADYGGDSLYRGLINVLGEEDIIEWPYKGAHHKAGVSEIQVGDHPVLPDHKGRMIPSPWFAIVEDAPIYDIEDILRMSFDLVVTESTRKGVWWALDKLKDRGFEFPPIAVTCSEDTPTLTWIPPHIFRVFPIKHMFVREPCGMSVIAKIPISPLPFGCSWGDVCNPGNPSDETRSGVYFQGSITHTRRTEVFQALDGMPQTTLIGCHANTPDIYGTNLRSALIGVSVRGHGIDTLRHWEIPFFGALLVTDSTVPVHEDFTHGVDCFRYSQPHELRTLIENLLRRPKAELLEIAARGQSRLLTHHTNTARAKYLLDKMGVL